MDNAVDDYLAAQPPAERKLLEGLRKAILAAEPEVEEVIRWGVPAFRYRGKLLFGIGTAKHHMAMYVPYGRILSKHAESLKNFDVSSKAVRFTLERPMPARMAVKLLKARLAEIARADNPFLD